MSQANYVERKVGEHDPTARRPNKRKRPDSEQKTPVTSSESRWMARAVRYFQLSPNQTESLRVMLSRYYQGECIQYQRTYQGNCARGVRYTTYPKEWVTLDLRGGILGLPTGTGKTRVTIAFLWIVCNCPTTGSDQPVSKYIASHMQCFVQPVDAVECQHLVIAPSHVMGQWIRELEWCNKVARKGKPLSYKLVQGDKTGIEMKQLVESDSCPDVIFALNSRAKQLLLDKDKLHTHALFDVVVWDEPDSNYKAIPVPLARSFWFVTATFKNLPHDGKYCVGAHTNISGRTPSDNLAALFVDVPEEKYRQLVTRGQKASFDIRTSTYTYTLPALLRLLSQETITSSSSFEALIESREQTFRSKLSAIQAKVDEALECQRTLTTVQLPQTLKASCERKVLQLPHLQQQQNTMQEELDRFLRKTADILQDGCPICCGDGAVQSPVALKCGHVFCQACILQWSEIGRSCPCCRLVFNAAELRRSIQAPAAAVNTGTRDNNPRRTPAEASTLVKASLGHTLLTIMDNCSKREEGLTGRRALPSTASSSSSSSTSSSSVSSAEPSASSSLSSSASSQTAAGSERPVYDNAAAQEVAPWQRGVGSGAKIVVYLSPSLQASLVTTMNEGRYFFRYLTAGTSRRKQKKIEEFQRHDGPAVLLLGNRDEAAGLDLGFATDVIFHADLSSATQTQIIGRLTRIGRPSYLPVYVHKLQVQRDQA